ncbi:unnamed protein product, partial [Staurois parvus]
MQGPGRADIANAGSGESGYSECRVRGLVTFYDGSLICHYWNLYYYYSGF